MSQVRRTPRQQRSRQTVAWILEAAAQLFDAHGHARTTTNGIAERAGVSIGSLYQYFAGKDAILAALAEQHLDEATDAVLAVLADAVETRAPLPRLLADLAECAVRQHVRLPRLHLLLSRSAPVTPHLAARLEQDQQRIAAALADALRRLGVGGADPEASALLAVQGMLAQLHGALLAPPGGRSVSEVVEEAVRMWTAALSVPARP